MQTPPISSGSAISLVSSSVATPVTVSAIDTIVTPSVTT